MTFTINSATTADISEIKELITLSAHYLNAQDYNPKQIEGALAWVFGVDTQLIEDGTYYVVRLESQMVGCGGWSKRQKNFGGDQTDIDSQDLLDPKRNAAKIRAFFVHPEFARKGIGTALLDSCEQAAKAYGFTKAELTATLTVSKLYSAKGYEAVSQYDIEVPDYGAFPVIKMQRNLLPQAFISRDSL